ncbi:hypothetical protein VNO77_36692 [Canavalia gladiata]|uniref:Senescence regulator S40 n=1 Tax=Canavalia gladiata TaxID=3824 RepID=A0AAN9K7G7_CANGL
MDLFDSNRFPNRKPTLSERFLGVTTHAQPLIQNPTASDDELQEDDVVFFSADLNHNNASTSSSSSSVPNHHRYSHGILAALPENETASPNLRNVSYLFHKGPISSIPSSSSSRLIPVIPRPQPPAMSSPARYHQSAPVNVPVLSKAMMKERRRHREFEDGEEEEGEEEEMVPPHEIIARNSEQSPMLAYSVLEGVGRTLKGRDLRQVRNAVWRQTGFPG